MSDGNQLSKNAQYTGTFMNKGVHSHLPASQPMDR